MTREETRDETADRFAAAIGWEFDAHDRGFCAPHPTIRGAMTSVCDLPEPDAPLHSHLAFVGRVAEALGASHVRVSYSVGMAACVKFAPLDGRTTSSAPDLSHAAMLAALAARGSR